MQQALFQGVQLRERTVALWEGRAALTPAVIVLANKLTLRFTANVVECCLDEAALKVARQDGLQPCGGPETAERKTESQMLISEMCQSTVEILTYLRLQT